MITHDNRLKRVHGEVTAARREKRQINLRGFDLSGLSMSGFDLRGANLRGANLRHTNLSWSDMSKVDLSWADARGANMSGADLDWANLFGANLKVTNLSAAHWDGLYVDGIHPYRCMLVPLPFGWEVSIGCWSGTVEELRELVAGDNWPESRGSQITRRRPFLTRFADLCDMRIADHPNTFIADLEELWSTCLPPREEPNHD